MASGMDAVPGVPTLRGSVRSLPRTVWVLFGGTFVSRVGAFVLPFFTLYLTRKGYSPAQAGVAVGAYGLGELAAWSTGGLLADRPRGGVLCPRSLRAGGLRRGRLVHEDQRTSRSPCRPRHPDRLAGNPGEAPCATGGAR